MSEDQKPPEEKNRVIVKDGQKVKSGLTETEANTEATRLKKVDESAGKKSSVEVKQTILG
jgi:hypothetical protein